MAHRKLQQEIDRVFKKITEGLDIFNTYHERHEHASNTSQKDKLENDLKREIKKLQKLREQIKVWQTSSDVKDKDKLLEHRRLVEVAMEQYKVIEKGSKVKAYSNTSLKAVNDLDPEEKEKVECINFIQESIDDLESQFQNCEVELDKLNSKKSKKVSSSTEAKKEELKEFQSKYRWHQQNLELALRLLENGELVVDDINEIKEDLVYFLTSNRDPNFIDNEYLYESLDLDSNEILQHDVVTSFNGLNEKETSPGLEDEEIAVPPPPPSASSTNNRTSPSLQPQVQSQQPKPSTQSIDTPKKESKVLKKLVTSTSNTPISQPSTPINTNGLTSSLKPAVTPVKPTQPDIKWSSLVAGLSDVPANSTNTSSTNSTSTQPQQQPIEKTSSLPQPDTSKPQLTGTSTSSSGLSTTSSQETQTSIQSKVSDSEYLVDSSIISLPPGIQDIILSFYSNRVNVQQPTKESNSLIGSHRSIKNVSNYLNQSRYYLFNNSSELTENVKMNYSKDLSLEFQKCSNEWNKVRLVLKYPDTSINNEKFNSQILSNLELSTLFYGYFFSLTPFESFLISKELNSRGWSLSKDGKNWTIEKNVEIKPNQEVEKTINKFDVENWNLTETVEKNAKITTW